MASPGLLRDDRRVLREIVSLLSPGEKSAWPVLFDGDGDFPGGTEFENWAPARGHASSDAALCRGLRVRVRGLLTEVGDDALARQPEIVFIRGVWDLIIRAVTEGGSSELRAARFLLAIDPPTTLEELLHQVGDKTVEELHAGAFRDLRLSSGTPLPPFAENAKWRQAAAAFLFGKQPDWAKKTVDKRRGGETIPRTRGGVFLIAGAVMASLESVLDDVDGIRGAISARAQEFTEEQERNDAGARARERAIRRAQALSRLERRSRRLSEDLGRQIESVARTESESPVGDAEPLYVPREVERALLDLLAVPGSGPIVLSGPAGYGKSSVLWHLAKTLEQVAETRPVLFSATWLSAVAGDDGFSADQLREQLADLGERARTVLLFDTADLLLHSDVSIESTVDLIEDLDEIGIAVVLSVRPVEATELQYMGWRKLELGGYAPGEMDDAARALMRRIFPDMDPRVGVELVRTAQVRQLPLLEICRSPLLLRLLFELSGEVLPSVEIDVTGLYRQYWARRVERDQRGRRDDAAVDLSAAAERVGIAMLVEGTPEPPTAVLKDLAESVEHVKEASSLPADLATLEQRGVLLQAGPVSRFFHQTMFEYAAALALLHRGGAAEATRLLAIVKERPYDLFVGTVLEQLLIILGRAESTRPDVRDIVRVLLDDGRPTLSQIGLIVWGHYPDIVSPPVEDRTLLPQAAIERFLGQLPQVWDSRIPAVTTVLQRLWKTRADQCAPELVRTMGRLAHRFPKEIADVVAGLDIVDHFARGTGKVSQSNLGEVFTLIFALAHQSPELVRNASLVFLSSIPHSEVRIQVLRAVADHWTVLHDEVYLESIASAVAGAQKSKSDPDGRSVRAALGAIIRLERDRCSGAADESADAAWTQWAQQTFAQVGSRTNPVRLGADLAAVAWHLHALDEADGGHIDEVLDAAFRVPVRDGPPQLVGNFLGPLLAADTPARRRLLPRLARALDGGLPSPLNANGLTPAQHLATMARVALKDDRIPPHITAQLLANVAAATEAGLTQLDVLVELLPVSAAGGHRIAAEIVRSISDDPDRLDHAPAGRFLSEGERLIEQDPMVAEACVVLALRRHADGVLKRASKSEIGRATLVRHTDGLHALLSEQFDGVDRDQRAAADLWKQLQHASVLLPEVSEVVARLKLMRDPYGKALLIGMLPAAVDADAAQGADAIAAISQYVRSAIAAERQRAAADGSKRVPPGLVDAALDAWRMILGSHPTPDGWETLRDLAFEPRVSGDQRLDSGKIKSVNAYLRALARSDTAFALDCFLEAGILATTTPYSQRQQRQVANDLFATVEALVPVLERDETLRLMKALDGFPRILGERVIRTALRRKEARTVIEEALESGFLRTLQQYAAEHLRANRELGTEPLPELRYAAPLAG